MEAKYQREAVVGDKCYFLTVNKAGTPFLNIGVVTKVTTKTIFFGNEKVPKDSYKYLIGGGLMKTFSNGTIKSNNITAFYAIKDRVERNIPKLSDKAFEFLELEIQNGGKFVIVGGVKDKTSIWVQREKLELLCFDPLEDLVFCYQIAEKYKSEKEISIGFTVSRELLYGK